MTCRSLIVDGYKFRFQKTLANGVQRWLCSKSASQKCYAFLKFDVGGVMIEKRLEHNHEPLTLLSLHSMFYHSHPNIYLFLEAVQEIQTGNYIKINTAHTQRKVRRAKASVEKEYFIAQEMKRFTNGEIDRLTYVKSLSRKFPPQNL